VLKRRVLVLNASYEPLHICSARRAIIMLFLGKAERVEDDSVEIHSPSITIRLPNVVRLSQFVKQPVKEFAFTRKNIIKRDRGRCQYCGREDPNLTIDHVIPLSRGGKHTWTNVVAACHRCNSIKGDRTPEQAGLKLLKAPREPGMIPYLHIMTNIPKNVDSRWKKYLFWEAEADQSVYGE